jgi:hypothetical protein
MEIDKHGSECFILPPNIHPEWPAVVSASVILADILSPYLGARIANIPPSEDEIKILAGFCQSARSTNQSEFNAFINALKVGERELAIFDQDLSGLDLCGICPWKRLEGETQKLPYWITGVKIVRGKN